MDRCTRRRGFALACAAVVLSLAGGCGCGNRRVPAAGPSRLRLTRLRFANDERKALCYVVAEVENAGQLPVREVKVTATLRSRGGQERGINYASLQDIQPAEKRVFYMTVTTHGRFHHVEVTFGEADGGS